MNELLILITNRQRLKDNKSTVNTWYCLIDNWDNGPPRYLYKCRICEELIDIDPSSMYNMNIYTGIFNMSVNKHGLEHLKKLNLISFI